MSRNISINVGAKNKASKVLNKVGQDVTKVGGFATKAAEKVRSAARRMNTSVASIAKAAAGIAAGIIIAKAAIAGFKSVINSMGASINAFNVQDQAVRGLTKALELNGESADGAIEKHKAWAAQLQTNVNVGDEVTLGLMKQASMLGVSEDQLQQTTKAAIGLAEVTGQSLESSMQKTVQAMNGNATILSRYIPAVKTAKTEQEKLAAVMEVAAKGFANAKDKTGSLEGIMTRASNSFGDFREVIGQILAPIKMLTSQGVAVFAESMQSMLGPAVDRAKATIANLGPTLQKVAAVAKVTAGVVSVVWQATANIIQSIAGSIADYFGITSGSAEGFAATARAMAEKIIKAITWLEVTLTNLPDVFRLIVSKSLLWIEQLRADIIHAFTVTLPARIVWFANAIPTIIVEMGNAVIATIGSMVKNVGVLIGRMVDVATGRASSLDIAGLIAKQMDEVNQIAADINIPDMPELISRQLTDKERSLTAKVAEIGGKLGDKFGQKFKERSGQLDKLFDEIKATKIDFGGLGALPGNAANAANASSNENQVATVSRTLTRGRNDKTTELIDAINKGNALLKEIKSNTVPQESSGYEPNRDSFTVEVVS